MGVILSWVSATLTPDACTPLANRSKLLWFLVYHTPRLFKRQAIAEGDTSRSTRQRVWIVSGIQTDSDDQSSPHMCNRDRGTFDQNGILRPSSVWHNVYQARRTTMDVSHSQVQAAALGNVGKGNAWTR